MAPDVHKKHYIPAPLSPDHRIHPEPVPSPGVTLPIPPAPTPFSRLAAKEFGASPPPRPRFRAWLLGTVIGWSAFAGFLLFMAWLLLAIVRGAAALFGDDPRVAGGLGEAIGNIVALILI